MSAKKKTMTKAALMSELATKSDLTKVKVEELFGHLEGIIQRELRGAGEVAALPGLLKIKKKKKAATKARMWKHPGTGEEKMLPAKPASTKVGVTILKGLKEMI